jgi:hypothetical protein
MIVFNNKKTNKQTKKKQKKKATKYTGSLCVGEYHMRLVGMALAPPTPLCLDSLTTFILKKFHLTKGRGREMEIYIYIYIDILSQNKIIIYL